MKSEFQIERERKAWARGRLLTAWMMLSKTIEEPTLGVSGPSEGATRLELEIKKLTECENDLLDARSVAAEWRLDCEAIILEAEGLITDRPEPELLSAEDCA